jgi:hypothetical protein
MSKDILIWIMLGEAVGIGTMMRILRRLSAFTDRTLDDVPEFLQPIRLPDIENIFDPAKEREDLAGMGNVRRAQRARLALAREYVFRMQHNATIVYEWASTEWEDMVAHTLEYDRDTRERILALRREAILFGICSSMALARMWFWSLIHFEKWRFLPLPSVAAMRSVGGVDLVQAYVRVKDAALALALVYGQEHCWALDALMG